MSLIELYEASPPPYAGEISNEEMLRNLNDLLASLPQPLTPPPQFRAFFPPPHEIVLATDRDDSDAVLAGMDDDDDDDDEEYQPSLGIRMTDKSSDHGDESDTDMASITESEYEAMQLEYTTQLWDLTIGRHSRAVVDTEAASTAATVDQDEPNQIDVDPPRIFTEIFIDLSDSEDEVRPKLYQGLGDSPFKPITIE